jgi:SulP family sulfate permease
VFLVALGTSLALDLEHRGVAVVGAFPGGVPRPTWPDVGWREIRTLFPAAMGIALLTYTEGILLARAFAAKNGYEVNANQELTALGIADLLTGLFQGFSVTGSQSRTAINDAAGGKTQVAGLVAAGTLTLFLLFFTPLMARLPAVALAAILIFGGFSLIEFRVVARLYRFYHGSGVLAALTALAVLAIGVVPGILLGVGLSLLGLINRISHPPDAVLREVPGHGFHDLGAGPVAPTVPGLLTYRFYAPLVFCNAAHFVSRVRLLIAQSSAPTRWFLVDAQAITDIDATAAEALHTLTRELQAQGIALKFAHTNRPLRAVLDRIGLSGEIGPESFFSSVHECVQTFLTQQPAASAGVPIT